MVLQKIKDVTIELEKRKCAYGYWCYHVYINGKMAGLETLNSIDEKYQYSIWFNNKCFKTYVFDTIKQAKQWFSDNAFIFICNDQSFGTKIIDNLKLRALLSDKISWTGKRYTRLKEGYVSGDFFNKIYYNEIK